MSFVAIIPSLGALGPLGLLALIAPAAFAALMLWMRRWKAALGALSVMSTVFLLQGWWQAPLRPTWLSTRAGLWAVLAGLAGIFCVWALNRARPANSNGCRTDGIVIGVATILSALGVAYSVAEHRGLESLGLASMVVLASSIAALFALCSSRVAERGLLIALAIGCAGISMFETVRAVFASELRVEWVFEPDRPGQFLSPPFVTENRLFIGAVHHDGFSQDGTVYAIDPTMGRQVWSWPDERNLRPVFGTPYFADHRLYFGEGLHADRNCRLWCFDLSNRTPEEYWSFGTGGHVESSPAVHSPRVFFGAGDDGLYCLEIGTGKKVWQLENLHIDATPLVNDGVVYVGSYSAADNRHKELQLLAIDAETGRPIWRRPIDLSCYSQPVISEGAVYFSLGTGDLESSGPNPAGAVVALQAATGELLWRQNLADSAFASPIIDENLVIVGCNNGSIIALNRHTGRQHWKYEFDSPVVGAAAQLSWSHSGTQIVAISKSGICVKLAGHSGKLIGEIDLVRAANGTSGLFTAAPVVGYLRSIGRRVYVAGAITRGVREAPVLFCLMDGF